ncbi:MAG: alpha/beta hydrolase-fold protein [Thermogutta sp.]
MSISKVGFGFAVMVAFATINLGFRANPCWGQMYKDLHAKLEKKVYTDGEGGSLPYRLWKPENYDPNKKYPLIVFLHGAGERGDDNEAQLKNDEFLTLVLDPDHPAILIAPQCPRDSTWSAIRRPWDQPQSGTPEPTPGMKRLIGLLDELRKELPIDPDRCYLTGLSMGGFGTFDLLLRQPNDFAAAVPICGGGNPERAGEIAHIPMWIFHGGADPVVPVKLSQDMVKALEKAGGKVRYTEFPGVGHNSWSKAYQEPELRKWLFEQVRQKKEKSEG